MQFFLDTADVEEIKDGAKLGIIDGVTTNPSLMAKTNRTREEVISEIAEIIDGPISAEVISTDEKGMVEEGRALAKIHPNIVVKLPLTEAGISACKVLTSDSIKTNVTLVFSPTQALLAGKAGATYVSPFIGRLDDVSFEGMNLIREIRVIFDNYGIETNILAASVRHALHVREAALVGADVVTCPLKIVRQLYQHPQTAAGLEKFLKDHEKSLEKNLK